jgi:hypothetical protein
MTAWCGPDLSPSFEIVYGAIKTHGSSSVSAPPGPDFHQFARMETSEKLLREAGFYNIDLTIVDYVWDLDSPEGLSEIYEKATVRAAMVLARQPEQNLTGNATRDGRGGAKPFCSRKSLAGSCSSGAGAGYCLMSALRMSPLLLKADMCDATSNVD